MRQLPYAIVIAAIFATPLFGQEAAPAPPAVELAQARPPQPAAPPRPGGPAPPVVQGRQVAPEPPPAPRPPAAPTPAPTPTQNVRVNVAIADSLKSGMNKTVTVLVADGRNGRVRSQSHGLDLNVDVFPRVLRDGAISLDLTLAYLPESSADPSAPSMITESMSVLVADGKPTQVSQSADPGTDRRVTIEVTATIVR